MKRYYFLLVMLLCLLVLCSGCKSNVTEADGSSSSASSLVTAPSSGESTEVKLVFHDTIEDPQGKYMDSLGGGGSETAGTTSLDLVLYEAEEGIFEGCGIIRRSIEISQDETDGSTQEYIYRTGHIRAEAGKDGSVALIGWLTYDSRVASMLIDAPFNVEIRKDATLRHDGLPLRLELNGKQASLSIKLHEYAEFVFNGELTSQPVESPVAKPSDMENLIYINSLWSESFSNGIDDGEYTAILLADSKSGTYSGELSVLGTGNALGTVNEEVTFSFLPFDVEAYQEAGGAMDDFFTAMSIVDAGGGTYILLLDGEQVIMEAVGKGIYFCGCMTPKSESMSLQNEAAKTKEMLSYLYRQKNGTEGSLPDYSKMADLDPSKPEDMQKLIEMSEKLNETIANQAAPAWYPENLIPMISFSAYDGFLTIPSPDKLLFRIYSTIYSEIEDYTDLAEAYRKVLSSYDNYQECQDDDLQEVVFIFMMGKYTVQVFLSQSVPKMTEVSIQIF